MSQKPSPYIKKYCYIEPKYVQNVLAYKYRGEDRSIYVKYVLSPLCAYIISKTPEWIAPNLITVTGWFLNLLYFILMIGYGGWGTPREFPCWVCCAMGILYELYIILDYCDGKQARKLGLSSPLGLLVDHGCDACTTFFVSIAISSFLYLDNLYKMFLVYFGISATFFFSTWEEYYIGYLDLPEFHGVAEGSLLIMFSAILCGFLGKKTLNTHLFYLWKFDIKLQIALALIVFIGAIPYIIKSFVGTLFKLDKTKRKDAIKTAFFYVIFASVFIIVPYFHDSIIIRKYPKFFILTFGLEFAKLMSTLQLSHVKLCPFPCYSPVFLIPIMVTIVHTIIYHYTGVHFPFSIDKVIQGCFVWNLLSWVHFVYYVSDEICEICNINRLTVGKRYPELGDKNKKSN